ncbi:MAG: hypothetical protein WC342_05695 [Methanoregula sp.]|jgi:hypothetical protein
MTPVSEIASHWLGLCRKPPIAGIMQTGIGFGQEPVLSGQPAGSGGGLGSIRRGVGAVLDGMKMLNRNRQLLWFTLLAGLVLVGSALFFGALGYISWAMQPEIGETQWVILTIIIEYCTLFSLVFLLAGLVLGIPTKKEGYVSFFESISRAKEHLPKIVVWSGILAIAGMLLFSVFLYSPDWLPYNHLLPEVFGVLFGSILNPLMEFPFNPALTQSTVFDPSRVGGIASVFWIYPSGIMQALIFSEINLLLFVLTPFVVPFIVLEKKTLQEAVTGSFALIKKNWDEVAVSTIFLIAVAIGVFLTYLLVQAASGLVTPNAAVTITQENPWIVLALVYDSALFCFAMIMATVGGIAAVNLFTSAKNRQTDDGIEKTVGVVI